MRTHLASSLLLLMLFLGAANQASWLFLFLLFALSFLFPLLFTIWLVPGGFAWHRYSGAGSIAPGPIGWPLLGCLTLMGPLAHRKLAKLSKSHRAAHLMALSLGATPVVVSSHPDTAREILHGPAFSDRPAKISARMLMFERAIGFAPAGDYWRHLRRVASTSMFSPRRIAALACLRHQVAGRMVGRVWKEMEGTGLVVLRELLQESCLENMVGSVFGLSLGEAETKELVDMVRKGYELIGQFNLEDYSLWVAFWTCLGWEEGKIVERRRHGDYRMQDDFLSLLLSLPKEETLRDGIPGNRCGCCTLGVDYGQDGPAPKHPSQSPAGARRRGRRPAGSRTLTRPPKLRYLQAVVKEVLRMHPPGPLLSWARLAVRDVFVGKYFVPAGTTAMVNMWAITHDESNWEDPWAFRPDRFLEADVSVLGSDLRLSPFGSGRRVCPGRALGVATAHLWLARLLQQFGWTAGRPVQLSERLRLSLEMKKPLACRVVRRGRVDAE
ncbi:hypothetical protein C4D60_Mb06t20980 [Musa balbisiana]|uniref:Uncharacterized protein n=1 Tax=Musa balbisiana TaxID=52838 RepID=A0A4S8IPQ6_MUSBA|nr:hypothetical protein C4D60_Mb06t20980 [Musa balbisiana]